MGNITTSYGNAELLILKPPELTSGESLSSFRRGENLAEVPEFRDAGGLKLLPIPLFHLPKVIPLYPITGLALPLA
jgi:hypothetical protein